MKKFELYVGCNVEGKETHDRGYVRFVIKRALKQAGFDGCTFTEAVGLWKGISELTVICTICTDRPSEEIYKLVGSVKSTLRQESVMVIESNPKIDFI